MTQPRIIVVGASGYVGSRVLMAATAQGANAVGISSRTGGQSLGPIDLTQADAFDYATIRAHDRIILCSAISSPEACSREHEHAYAVNVTGTKAFINKCTERGARVIFLSSDTVYGATSCAVDEDAPCHPVGAYGAMKHEVEQAVGNNPGVKVARLSYVLSDHDKFSSYLAGCAARDEPAEVFHPFSRRVIHLDDVVAGLLALADQWERIPYSLINFGGPELVTRLDIANEVRKQLYPDLRIQAVEPEAAFFEERPRVIDMSTNRLAQILARPTLTLSDAIALAGSRLPH